MSVSGRNYCRAEVDVAPARGAAKWGESRAARDRPSIWTGHAGALDTALAVRPYELTALRPDTPGAGPDRLPTTHRVTLAHRGRRTHNTSDSSTHLQRERLAQRPSNARGADRRHHRARLLAGLPLHSHVQGRSNATRHHIRSAALQHGDRRPRLAGLLRDRGTRHLPGHRISLAQRRARRSQASGTPHARDVLDRRDRNGAGGLHRRPSLLPGARG